MPAWLTEGQLDYFGTSPKSQQLHTDWTARFSVGGRPAARIFGLARTEDCNSWSKLNAFVLLCAWHILICLSLNPRCLADLMMRISSCPVIHGPNYITPPTDRRKCGAERVSFSGESSISVPSPVKEITWKFEKQGRAQEQSTLWAAHITAIGYRPALRYPFGGVDSDSIPRWKIRWDSLVCSPVLFHCTLEGSVRPFLAAMWSEILNFCCLLVFHGLHQTIMQFLKFLCQECKIHLDGYIFRMELRISSDCNLSFRLTDLSFYLLSNNLSESPCLQIWSGIQLPHRIPGDISMHYSDSLP